jgi:hypothetical protein
MGGWDECDVWTDARPCLVLLLLVMLMIMQGCRSGLGGSTQVISTKGYPM